MIDRGADIVPGGAIFGLHLRIGIDLGLEHRLVVPLGADEGRVDQCLELALERLVAEFSVKNSRASAMRACSGPRWPNSSSTPRSSAR